MMASFVRPNMLRQSCLSAPFKRTLTTKIPGSSLPRSRPASIISRQAARNVFVKDALPGSMRVAAFHASSRQLILPPLPRKFEITLLGLRIR
jgi:succinate dehydrogenase (ubiquinone) membrane anchor subunit